MIQSFVRMAVAVNTLAGLLRRGVIVVSVVMPVGVGVAFRQVLMIMIMGFGEKKSQHGNKDYRAD